MATEVASNSELILFSGKKIQTQPLKIKFLRKFMDKFDEMIAIKDNNIQSMDLLMECVGIALQQWEPEIADNKELLEDEFDLPRCYKAIEVASGIKFGDDENPPIVGQSGAIST